MDVEDVRKIFNDTKSDYNIGFEAKEEQINIALSFLKKRNVIGLLPTGFGKTLCMVLPAILKRETKPITLIISPLSSLIDDQIVSLEKWNFKCAKISAVNEMEKDVLSGIAQGDFQFVFSSPESVLKQYWKKIFLTNTWQSRLHLIAVDEAHCISEWGEDFRKEYQELHELRSFFNVPIMALTATSTNKVKEDIFQHLQLTVLDTDVVFKSPDRPNIFIHFLKRDSTEVEMYLKWLIDHIKENGVNSKKIVLYCRSIDRVSDIFLTLKDSLDLHAYANREKNPNNLLVEMFHKSTFQASKDRIIAEFRDKNSKIRCIIATVALGMGLDIRDIDMVVHIGCPKSILSYWQEAGRCARDGRNGFSLVVYDNFTLSLKSTDKEIAKVVKNTDIKCLRKQIVNNLTIGEPNAVESKPCEGCILPRCQCQCCKCCHVCLQKCPCQKRCNFSYEQFLLSAE